MRSGSVLGWLVAMVLTVLGATRLIDELVGAATTAALAASQPTLPVARSHRKTLRDRVEGAQLGEAIRWPRTRTTRCTARGPPGRVARRRGSRTRGP
jgi:hypothetical protein